MAVPRLAVNPVFAPAGTMILAPAEPTTAVNLRVLLRALILQYNKAKED